MLIKLKRRKLVDLNHPKTGIKTVGVNAKMHN
jgi:hypothetical protein